MTAETNGGTRTFNLLDPISDYLLWCNHKGHRESTKLQKHGHLYRFELWLSRNRGVRILDVKGPDLEAWQIGALVHLGDNATASAVMHARAFYRWASEWERCSASLLRYLQPPRPRMGLPRPIPQSELDVALALAGPRVWPWLMLAAGAGLRACEVAQLRREHLEPHARGVSVLVYDGKAGKDRVVPAVPGTELILRELPSRGWLFPAQDRQRRPAPGHVNEGQVSKLSSRFLHEIGSASTFHALRHRFLTDFYTDCLDIRLLQEVAGWSDIRQAQRYVALVPGAAVGVSSRLRTLANA